MQSRAAPKRSGGGTRRAPDFVHALQQIPAGFEPSLRARSSPALNVNTPMARLKPGAVGPVMMQRPGRAEVFALPAPLGLSLP
jgi:hypothetical protein